MDNINNEVAQTTATDLITPPISRASKYGKKTKKRKKITIWTISLLVLSLLIGTTTYGVVTYLNFRQTIDQISKNNLPEVKQVDNLKMKPFTVLFIGIGSNGNDGQNTLADSINLITINPSTRYAEIIAIPRDAYIPFGDLCEWGAGRYDKATHATGIDAGGPQCLQSTLEDLFDVEINYYVSVDFNGFVQIVDALNGVDMNVPDLRAGFENYYGDPSDGLYMDPRLKNGEQWCESDSNRIPYAICFNTFGMQHLNGEQALALARSRHYDSDLGRSMRQTELIKAIGIKAASSISPLSINALMDAAGDSIETNIPVEQFTGFLSLAKSLFSDDSESDAFVIRTTQLTVYGRLFVGDRISGNPVYYSEVPVGSVEDIRKKIHAALQDGSLDISVEDFSFDPLDTSGNASKYSNSPRLGKGDDVTDPSVVKKFSA